MKNIIKKVKGFTLTELAIVIAVIAILIAVLVPTFISLINNANESKDMQMIYNVNNALAVESASSTIETPEQALDVAEDAGYKIENLTPTSDGQIVYDSANVRFVFIATDGTIYPSSASDIKLAASTTWYFASSQDDIDNGSATASYIVTGTWNSDVVYSGIGSLDTSRATVYGGIVAGSNGNSVDSGNVALASKKVTADPTGTDTIILNIVSGYAILIYPVSGKNYVIYSDADYNFDGTITESSYTVVGKGKLDENIKYKEADGTNAGGVTINDKVISTVCKENDADTTTSFVLELGTSKYPYLIDDAEELNALSQESTEESTDAVYYQLTTSFEDASAITIASGKNIVLDLYGHTLTISSVATASGSNTANIINNGTLTITDSSTKANGTLDVSTGTYGIYNTGSIELAGGTITVTNSSAAAYGIYSTTSSGTITVSGGTLNVKATNSAAGCHANGIYQDKNAGATVNVTGGEINASSYKSAYAIIYKIGATINVSGGKITASGGSGTYYGVGINNTNSLFTINITGGEISGYDGVYANGNGESVVNISGGTITSSCAAIYLSNVIATISGVTATGSTYATQISNSTVTINSGTYKGGTYAVYLGANADVTITGGTFTGSTYKLFIFGDNSVATVCDSVFGEDSTIGKNDAKLASTVGNDEGTTLYSLKWTASNASASVTDSSDTTTYYGTLSEAITAAINSSGEIKLLKDYTGDINFLYDLTIDLNGHNWTYAAKSEISYLMQICSNVTVNLQNSSNTQSVITYTAYKTDKKVALPAIYNYGMLNISGNISIVATGNVDNGEIDGIRAAAASTTTIGEKVSIKATNSGSGIAVGIVCWGTNDENSYTTLTINGGTIYGGTYGVDGNGSYSYTNVTISDGSIEGGSVGYYHPEIGNLTITGGSIKGYYAGLQICAGNVTISGGTFTATISNPLKDTNNVYQKSGDGAIADGAALSIISRSNYGAITSVKISNGTFISASGIEAIQFYSFTNSDTEISAITDQTIVSITGGEFSSSLAGTYSAYCIADDYSVSDAVNANGYYEVAEKATQATE